MKLGMKIMGGVLILGMVAAFMGPSIVKMVNGNKSNSITSTAPAYEPEFVKEGTVDFLSAGGEVIKSIDVEVADDAQSVMQGWMWRKSMDEDKGMIFLFPQAKKQSFYMKNTYIPLDILFIDSSFRIINIARNTVPLTETNVLSDSPAQFVLEVNADFCPTTTRRRNRRCITHDSTLVGLLSRYWRCKRQRLERTSTICWKRHYALPNFCC